MGRMDVTMRDIEDLITNVQKNYGSGNFFFANKKKGSFRKRAVHHMDLRIDGGRLDKAATSATLFMMSGEVKTVTFNSRIDLFNLRKWLAEPVPVPEDFDALDAIRSYDPETRVRLGFAAELPAKA